MSEDKSPGARLQEMERHLAQLLGAHVALEAQVMVMDNILGFLMKNGGVNPSPQHVQGLWAQAVAALKAKYPGVELKVNAEQPKPALFVPTNGHVPKLV